ncbi:hypothetical protein PF010_g29672 [Phytophthora fragariae]|uniref:Uncharacterized protein n=1 Tax=Phytophthora fragariae TaxID=53985 RepID=A0A6G0JMJ6_9STRA|nr:hypothetical protein PF010_g29672 [Phytophthora fragariae]
MRETIAGPALPLFGVLLPPSKASMKSACQRLYQGCMHVARMLPSCMLPECAKCRQTRARS